MYVSVYHAGPTESSTDSLVGSRRLLTYQRMPDHDINQSQLLSYSMQRLAMANDSQPGNKAKADDLNSFRRMVGVTA